MLVFTVFFLIGYAAIAFDFATGVSVVDMDKLNNLIMVAGAVFVAAVAWLFNGIVDHYEKKTRIETSRTEKQYKLALQKEKELVRMKDHFIFVAAHELRSPVTAIKWSMEGLESGDYLRRATKADKQNFKNLKASSEQLVNLINDLLDTSRIEYGTFKVTIEPFAIEEAIKSAVNETKFFAEEHGIRISFKTPANKLPQVVGDKTRVKEVLINFITNAVKYNNQGGSVTVSTEKADGKVKINVTDTGIGLSKDDISKLFKKFSRIERDETENISGTGLGLFIVHQIIERIGGEIAVTSAGRGKGSTFSFTLPTK